MGRLLDEDMVINALQTTKFRNDLFVDRGYARAISIIKEQPTIQPEVLACGNGELVVKPEPQWIPVERELPEDFTDVLVWFEYFRYGDYNCLYQTHGIGTYVANYNLWTVNHETGWKDLRVIAWMPLPEPYNPNKKQSGKEGV